MSIGLSHKDFYCALSSFLCVIIAIHTLRDLEQVSTDSKPLTGHHRHGFTFHLCVCVCVCFGFGFFSHLLTLDSDWIHRTEPKKQASLLGEIM